MADVSLPPFDPRSSCVKCGYVIPEPIAPTKAGPDGSTMVTGPAPEPKAPTTQYCSGDGCPWADPEVEAEEESYEEHMHQWCDTCGYEWLAKPLDAA